MTTRLFSAPILGALAFAFIVAPTLPSQAQATETAASNTAPAAPAAPASTPTPAAPAPAETPASAPASTERPTSYTMVAGDSLDTVAKKFDTSIHALAKLNKIPKSKYRKLKTGTVLQIPPAKAEATTPAK